MEGGRKGGAGRRKRNREYMTKYSLTSFLVSCGRLAHWSSGMPWISSEVSTRFVDSSGNTSGTRYPGSLARNSLNGQINVEIHVLDEINVAYIRSM